MGVPWKFAKGRTFKHRAELSVEGELLSSADKHAIRARVLLRNTGLTKIPLRGKFVRLHAMASATWRDGNWKQLGTENVLQDHDWVEPGEPIDDEVLIPLSERDPALAYQLEFIVFEETERPFKSGQIQWTARRLIGGVLQPPTSEKNDEDGSGRAE